MFSSGRLSASQQPLDVLISLLLNQALNVSKTNMKFYSSVLPTLCRHTGHLMFYESEVPPDVSKDKAAHLFRLFSLR
jgi:hypothetical protein